MADISAIEQRTPPTSPASLAQAHANPGGWVYDIDFAYDEDDHVPPEAIRGAWEVSADGKMTGRYQRNEKYREIVATKRQLPQYMQASAAHNPGKWMAEIDPSGESRFPDIPDDLIIGWWWIDTSGKISEKFRPNSAYRSR